MVRSDRAALVVNPRVQAAVTPELWERAENALRSRGIMCSYIETRGNGDDSGTVARVVGTQHPDVVIVAGGDGTVSDVVQGMMEAEGTPPALAILPFGTANNVARSLGLLSCRHHAERAVDLAVATALRGRDQWMDLGQVDDRYFVGSFALGMDADILHTRNEYHGRLEGFSFVQGYPLYLFSCALNLLRPHGGTLRLTVDGATREVSVCNLLVTNTALYAGEFRFDAQDPSGNGTLGLHIMQDRLDYVRAFIGAWQRHLRASRRRAVTPPDGIERVREVVIQLGLRVPCQVDGEELAPGTRCRVRVVPRALRVRVPTAQTVTVRDRTGWASRPLTTS
jgi:diacylglycerol kinase family enzyme